MSIQGRIGSLFGGKDREIFECRNCGATLVTAEDACPYCGPTDVVTFEL